MPSPANRTLVRTLTLRDLVGIVIGTVIGSGIFIVPATVLRQTGGEVGPALVVWLIGGVLSLLGALTFGEMGAANPDAGGIYVYIRDAFGPLAAFLYGWTTFFVMGGGSIATLAVAFTGYLGQFVTLPPLAGKAVALAMIAVVTAINVRGTRRSATVQGLTTGIKVAAILVMSAILLAVGDGFRETAGRWWPRTVSAPLLSGVGLSMIGVLWAYEGWQYVTFSAGETRDPQRTFPRGIIAGTGAMIGIYLLANLGYVAALGPAEAARSERIAAAAVSTQLGASAGRVIAAVILVSIFSAANGLALTTPRLYYSMARDGVFFRRLAEVHPRFHTPAFAIIAGSLWAALLAATGTFEQLLTYVVFAGWLFYAVGALAIFTYRRRAPGAPRPFRVPGYPLTPVLFIASAAAVVLNTLVTQPRRGIVGLGMVLLGVPAFLAWRRAGRRAASHPPPERAEPVD